MHGANLLWSLSSLLKDFVPGHSQVVHFLFFAFPSSRSKAGFLIFSPTSRSFASSSLQLVGGGSPPPSKVHRPYSLRALQLLGQNYYFYY